MKDLSGLQSGPFHTQSKAGTMAFVLVALNAALRGNAAFSARREVVQDEHNAKCAGQTVK